MVNVGTYTIHGWYGEDTVFIGFFRLATKNNPSIYCFTMKIMLAFHRDLLYFIYFHITVLLELIISCQFIFIISLKPTAIPQEIKASCLTMIPQAGDVKRQLSSPKKVMNHQPRWKYQLEKIGTPGFQTVPSWLPP